MSGTKNERTNLLGYTKGKQVTQGCIAGGRTRFGFGKQVASANFLTWVPHAYFSISNFAGLEANSSMNRFKPEMWARVAEEMAVPWRAAEAMHWQLGEAEMARRAGVVPFSLTTVSTNDPSSSHRRHSPSRGHSHAHSHGSISRDPGMSSRYGRGQMVPVPPSRGGPSRRESVPARPPMPPDVMERPPMPPDLGHGPGLAPIHLPASQGRGSGMLPGIAELTTGVSPYSTPAYSMGMHSVSPVHSAVGSPYLPGVPHYQPAEPPGGSKRPGSPGMMHRETSRPRHMDLRYEEVDRRSMH